MNTKPDKTEYHDIDKTNKDRQAKKDMQSDIYHKSSVFSQLMYELSLNLSE